MGLIAGILSLNTGILSLNKGQVNLYLFQSDTETHFQCPACGQRGAVLTRDIDKAQSGGAHVRISCTACETKFEPKHRAVPEAFAELKETAPKAPDLAAAFEDVAATPPPEPAAPDDEFGALPAWLRPDAKEASDDEKPQSRVEKNPDDIAMEAIAAFIHADIGDPLDTAKPKAAAPIARQKKIEPEAETQAAAQAAIEIEPSLPPLAVPDRRSFTRSFFSIAWKIAAVALLAGLAYNYTLRDAPIVLSTPKLVAETLPLAQIQIGEVRHEILADAAGSAVKVSVRFTNSGTRQGSIESFNIVLLDEKSQRLASWKVSGRSHILAANGEHVISSTLFNPPKNIDRVSVTYPAR